MSNELVPYSDIEKMGAAVAGSGLFGVKTQQQAIALMLIAQAYGKHPAIAAMEYHIIEGKPSKKSEAMLSSFLESGGTVKWLTLTDEKAEAEFSHPKGGTITLDWTTARAQKAGLIDKAYSNHKKYPRAMLRARLISEGIRTIYPAATGGMYTPDEVQEYSQDVEIDHSKSRVEQLVENQIEDAHIHKEEVKEDAPKEKVEPVKKTNKKDSQKSSKVSDTTLPSLPEGHKEIIGLIDNSLQDESGAILCVKTQIVKHPTTGKESKKWLFLLDGNKYGTFDESLANKIMECVDGRIMVKIEYKERPSGEKILRDIVSFKQATVDEVNP